MEPNNQFFQVSIKLFLKNEKGEVLIMKMPLDSSMAGYYDFPGGRIAETEVMDPFSEIVKRELAEEIGDVCKWELKSTKPVAVARHNYESKKYGRVIFLLWVFFEANYVSGEIKPSTEHIAYDWVNLEKIEPEKYFVRGPLAAVKNYLGQE